MGRTWQRKTWPLRLTISQLHASPLPPVYTLFLINDILYRTKCPKLQKIGRSVLFLNFYICKPAFKKIEVLYLDHFGSETDFSIRPALTGVPQGSVLSILLYIVYIYDIPSDNERLTATNVDDTVLTNQEQQQAD